MSAQITVEQEFPILGQPTQLTFLLHTPLEIFTITRENMAAGQTTVIFTHRVATAKFIASGLRASGLDPFLFLLTSEQSRSKAIAVLETAATAGPRVIVVTDIYDTGWRVVSEAPVLHAELPPYTEDFPQKMQQREARVSAASPA